MARKQVKRMIRTESVLICTFGGLLGLVVGSVFGIALQHFNGGENPVLQFIEKLSPVLFRIVAIIMR
jgi:putative ABC transport system permease protein